MPEFFKNKVAGYYLYFTSQCVLEAFHAHASDKNKTEENSAKFWIYKDGSSKVMKRGKLTDHEISIIQKYIKKNFITMQNAWANFLKIKTNNINFKEK